MRITYDPEAHALYIYFREIAPGGVKETLPSIVTKFDFDNDSQIIAMSVTEKDDSGDKYYFGDKLKYLPSELNAHYAGGCVRLAFAATSHAHKTITWDTNLDLDADNQIVGIDVMLVDPHYRTDDGIERLYDGGLDNILRFRGTV